LLCSYGQIFFTSQRVFCVILLLVSFFDAPAGLAGLVAVLISQIVALLFNFNHALIRNGTYTYNSLMLGHWYFL
jgi:urea transporter